MSSDTQLTKTSTESFSAGAMASELKDKIRLDVAKLMPDEQWEQLLREEIQVFLRSSSRKNTYGDTIHQPSALRRIVDEVLRERTKVCVSEMLSTDEWAGFWDGQKRTAGKEIERIAKEAGPDIVKGLIGDAISSMVDSMKHRL